MDYKNVLIFVKVYSIVFISFLSKVSGEDDFYMTCPPVTQPPTNYLINTNNCQIKDYTIHFDENKTQPSCGDRKIYVTKLKHPFVELHKKIPDNCCYKYASFTYRKGYEDREIRYTECIPFIDGTITELLSEVLYIDCGRSYSDIYGIVKKKYIKRYTKKYAWNVVVIGIDNMSRARARSVLPRTVLHMKKHNWLDYRAYNKIGLNTYPNLMALIFNKKLDVVESICKNNSDKCNKMAIWYEYKKKSYMTAFGEDSVSSSMFKNFVPFKAPPTHHYMKPLFLAGERQKQGVLCTKTLHSADHILNYALDYMKTYQDKNYFGFFWLSSYSYFKTSSSHADEKLYEFLRAFQSSPISRDTFLFVISDHGINYGGERGRVDSYYDSRLPMLNIWAPYRFRRLHREVYKAMHSNQYKLVTPYDVHLTLRELPYISGKHDACPMCNSLFSSFSSNRRCLDVSIDNKWCACHELETHPKEEDRFSYGAISFQFIKDFNNHSRQIETKPCTRCIKLFLNGILRSHKYTYLDQVYYVIAFSLGPGNLTFEATLRKEGQKHDIINAIEPLYKYSDTGFCARKAVDAKYCVCETDHKCLKLLQQRRLENSVLL